MKKIYNVLLWGFIAFCLMASTPNKPAYSTPKGMYIFDYAELQERPLDSNGPYTTRVVNMREILDDPIFVNTPLEIGFENTETPFASVNLKTQAFQRYGCVPEWTKNGENLSLVVLEPTDRAIAGDTLAQKKPKEDVRPLAIYTNVQETGDRLKIQYTHVYSTKSNQYVEGIFTTNMIRR